MEFLIKNCSADKQIQQYVAACPHALIYYTSEYIALTCRLLQAEGGYLAAYKGSDIIGILPYMKKTGSMGTVYNSMAFYGSNGGVLQRNIDLNVKRRLISKFYQLAQEEKALSATLITNPLMQDSDFYEKCISYDFRDERIGQITRLNVCDEPEELMAFFESPRPRNIRKAIKSGVVVEPSQSDAAMEFLFNTHVANMEAIGGLSKPKCFFDSVPQLLRKDYWKIYAATINGEYVAALLLLYYGDTVEYFTPVILNDYRNTQALSLVIFNAMKDAKRSGFTYWNWGGTWLTQSGVYDFKKKWGTSDYPYYYFTKAFDPDLTKLSREFLLTEYSGFYVLPFSKLED